MGVSPKAPIRKVRARQDNGSKDMIKYNDPAGADKVIIIDPPIKRVVAVDEAVGAGKYVKVTGTSYTLDLIGRAHDPVIEYQFGDVVTSGGFVYQNAVKDQKTVGAFNAENWIQRAPKQIASIPCAAGAVVTTGRWHNTVTVAGFLVDDDSDTIHYRVRD